MPAWLVIARLDPVGCPTSETYLLDKDEDTLTVIALLKSFKKQPSQLRVIVDGLHVRGAPDEETTILRSLHVDELLPCLEIAHDLFGNEWARIAQSEWICRVYDGREKAKYV